MLNWIFPIQYVWSLTSNLIFFKHLLTSKDSLNAETMPGNSKTVRLLVRGGVMGGLHLVEKSHLRQGMQFNNT